MCLWDHLAERTVRVPGTRVDVVDGYAPGGPYDLGEVRMLYGTCGATYVIPAGTPEADREVFIEHGRRDARARMAAILYEDAITPLRRMFDAAMAGQTTEVLREYETLMKLFKDGGTGCGQ